MRALRWISALLIIAALLLGAEANLPSKQALATTDGYYVLAADFHLHSFPGDWATLAPWDNVIEAQRAHLDVIALSSHNHVWAGRLGHSMANLFNGPMILVGEEIVGPAPHYHMLAIGIHSTIDWRKSAEEAIDEIHNQGGIAIAAHPINEFWASYDSPALKRLDGAEVLHPVAFESERFAHQLRDFFAQGSFAAIGDSDYRGLGPAGMCRTYVFARERNEKGVLDAIRARRTVVYDRGRYFGDAQLIDLALREHLVQGNGSVDHRTILSSIICIGGGTGLAMAILIGPTGLFGRARKTADTKAGGRRSG